MLMEYASVALATNTDPTNSRVDNERAVRAKRFAEHIHGTGKGEAAYIRHKKKGRMSSERMRTEMSMQ